MFAAILLQPHFDTTVFDRRPRLGLAARGLFGKFSPTLGINLSADPADAVYPASPAGKLKFSMPVDPMNFDLIPPPPGGTELAPGVRALDADLRVQFSRGSGPGGQNVNKVNTRAELWVKIDGLIGLTHAAKARLATAAGSRLTQSGELHLASDTHRSQDSNRSALFERLRELIVQAMHEPKRRRKTKPSLGSKRRRLESKKRRSDVLSRRRNADH